MLNNPNTVPSASLNRWIVSILTFHFELQHVPGKTHGPDGLSQRPSQPNNIDEEEEDVEEDFDDWVNNLYGFTHLINLTVLATISANLLNSFATYEHLTQMTADFGADEYHDIQYTALRSDVAAYTDLCLCEAHCWLMFLKHPENISDYEYALIIRYAAYLFVDHGEIWERDPQGTHKHILYDGQHIRAIEAAHNDTGHHSFYVTNALLVKWYWWPYISQDIAWYVRTCHICQLRQTCQITIPPIIATPAPLFAKMYMNTMHLLRSGSFGYIV